MFVSTSIMQFSWVLVSVVIVTAAEKICDENCGLLYNPLKNPKIIGGKPFFPNQFPWLVPIKISSNSAQFYCGATIIKPKYLLTAAHCLEVENITKVEAMIGFHWLPGPNYNETTGFEKFIRVKHAVLHDEYDTKTVDNDIALLELEDPISFNAAVHAICLPRPESPITLAKKTATVAGWGVQNDTGAGPFPTKPHAANVTIWPWEKCKSLLTRDLLISDNMICASDEGKDACQGDSGGPLIMVNEMDDSENEVDVHSSNRYVQVGIVSWGMGCASQFPGMYTRVSRYTDWIQNVTAQADNCVPFAPK